MRIGELARSCEVNPKTVRYYEEVGLLPKPARTASGHRTYREEDRRHLQFIRRAKTAGLPLAGIRQVIPQVDGRQCQQVRARLRDLIANQLAEIERRLGELRALRATLRRHLGALSKPVGHAEGIAPGCICLDGSEPESRHPPATALVRRPPRRKSRPEGGGAA